MCQYEHLEISNQFWKIHFISNAFLSWWRPEINSYIKFSWRL